MNITSTALRTCTARIIIGSAILFASYARSELMQDTVQDSRPNVIIVYTDDQAQEDIGVYQKVNRGLTPNIDSLATRGITFTQFYSAAPICTPSRVALLTGKRPESAGLAGNAYGEIGLETNLTMASFFKEKGYETALVGKWHLGEQKRFHPLKKGFDRFFGHIHGVVDNCSNWFRWPGAKEAWWEFDLYEDYIRLDEFDTFENPRCDLQTNQYEQHLAFKLMDKAKQYIEEAKKPLFMLYAINQPHYPIQPLPELIPDQMNSSEELADAFYDSFNVTIDTMVGRLINDLRDNGKLSNSIIVYQADHGHSFESRNWEGINSDNEVNLVPFRSWADYSYRGGKFSTFEGGIKVPAIISFPEKYFGQFDDYPRGEVRDLMAINIDWFPTLASMITNRLPTNEYKIQGIDLTPNILENTSPERDTYFWHHFGKGFAYRKGIYKLFYYPNDPSAKDSLKDTYLEGFYLIDLFANPMERLDGKYDLKSVHKELFEQLKKSALQEYESACKLHLNNTCRHFFSN